MPSRGLSSSAVKRGGVAGVLAAALFVLSTILAQIAPTGLTTTPQQTTYTRFSSSARSGPP